MVIDGLPTGLTIGACAILGWSALTKAYRPQRLAGTIIALGAPRMLGVAGAVAIIGGELAVPLLVVCGLNVVAAILTIALASCFAAAAAFAMRRRLTVECACFGGKSMRPLGWAQLYAWPCWIVCAAAIHQVPSSDVRTRLILATGTAACLTLGQALLCCLAFRAARADRRSYVGG
jgi:hypothetical protein